MGFLDSYKHLEKLCGEVLNDDRRISAYIDEMLNTPNGSFYVKSWNEDLNNLKHYRWVRNKIAHDPECTEQNMCDPEDELWLDEFYSRIMNQTDPLSLYRQATLARTHDKFASKSVQITNTRTQSSRHEKTAHKNVGCATYAIISLLIIAGIVLLTRFI
ncbi:MAG: hypothetical protein J6Q89_00940 [Clostridia bacterium]|nr:hypothetical protein [Clostridia bacterium]